jgi:hypothetical protein
MAKPNDNPDVPQYTPEEYAKQQQQQQPQKAD